MSLAVFLLALVSQAASWPEQSIPSQRGMTIFVDICWRGLREPELFDSAIQAAEPTLSQVSSASGRQFTSSELEVTYVSDVHCSLRFRVATETEAMELAERLGERLGLRTPNRHWAADASPPLAVWQFPHVPIGRSYYALWVNVHTPRRFDAVGPVGVELWVSYGSNR